MCTESYRWQKKNGINAEIIGAEPLCRISAAIFVYLSTFGDAAIYGVISAKMASAPSSRGLRMRGWFSPTSDPLNRNVSSTEDELR